MLLEGKQAWYARNIFDFFSDEISSHFYEADSSSGAGVFSTDPEQVRSPVVRSERSAPRPFFPPPPPTTASTSLSTALRDFYDADADDVSTGPIYEDIDRMCSYRVQQQTATSLTAKPEVKPKEKKKKKSKRSSDQDHPMPYHTIDINAARTNDVINDRTYCNVDDRGKPLKGGNDPHANVIVNPMMSPFHTRLRTMSPASNCRPPLSPYSARLAATNTLSSSQSTPTKNNGASMYYYSDTLRHKGSAPDKKGGGRGVRDLGSGCRVDSDSGISVSRADFPMDETPTMRQQILMVNPSNSALTSLTSSPSSSPMSATNAASNRTPGCTSPTRGCTSPVTKLGNGQKNLVQKFVWKCHCGHSFEKRRKKFIYNC